MRRGVLAALVAAIACAAATPAQAQIVPFPTETPEPTATPTPSPTPVGGQVPPVVAPAPGLSAVAQRQDPARSGSSADTTLAGPLGVAWALDLPGSVQGLVTGGGRVYVSRFDRDAASSGGSGSPTIEALDAASGRRLWSVPFSGTMAYGDERLAVSTGEVVRVLDAATGAAGWEASGASRSDVLVAGGAVYHRTDSSNSRLAARSLKDGTLLWEQSTDGTDGLPAVAGDRLFSAGPCHAAAFDRRNGAALWDVEGGCSSGGGGGVATLAGTRMFPVGTDGLGPLDAADGARLAGPLPSLVTGDVGALLEGDRVRAFRIDTGVALWDAPGIAALGLPGTVAIRQGDGRLAVRDAVTGAEGWAGRLSAEAPFSSDDTRFDALVAGEGRLLVANGTTLVALAAQGSVAPAATSLRSTVGPAGRPFRVRATIAGPLLPATAQLELRSGKTWRAVARVAPAQGKQGVVRPKVTLRRNAVARLTGSGLSPSRPVRLYAQPVVTTRIVAPRPGGQVTARMRLRTVPGLRRTGRRVALYVVRGKSRTYRRLGTTRVGRDGRGAVRFAPLARRGGRIFVASCLVGARRLRLGGPDPVTRRCGAARVTVPRR